MRMLGKMLVVLTCGLITLLPVADAATCKGGKRADSAGRCKATPAKKASTKAKAKAGKKAKAATAAPSDKGALYVFVESGGCRILATESSVSRMQEIAVGGSVTWDGRCSEGLISGPGVLRQEGVFIEGGRSKHFAYYYSGRAKNGVRTGPWTRESLERFDDSVRSWTSLARVEFVNGVARGAPRPIPVRGADQHSKSFTTRVLDPEAKRAQAAAEPLPQSPGADAVNLKAATAVATVAPPVAPAPTLVPTPSPTSIPAPPKATAVAPAALAVAPATTVAPRPVAAPANETPPKVSAPLPAAPLAAAPAPTPVPAAITKAPPPVPVPPASAPPASAPPAQPVPAKPIAPAVVAAASPASTPTPAPAPAPVKATPVTPAAPAVAAAPSLAPQPAAPVAVAPPRVAAPLAPAPPAVAPAPTPVPPAPTSAPAPVAKAPLPTAPVVAPIAAIQTAPARPAIVAPAPPAAVKLTSALPEAMEKQAFGFGTGCYMDTLDGQLWENAVLAVKDRKSLRIDGWAVDDEERVLAEATYLRLEGANGRRYHAATMVQERPDVARHFGIPAFARAGYRAVISAEGLPPGEYEVTIVMNSKGRNVLCGNGRRLKL